MRNILIIVLLLITFSGFGQSLLNGTQEVINQVEALNLKNQDDKSLDLLNQALKNPANGPDDIIYLNTYKSGIFLERDSLKLGSATVDLVIDQIDNTNNPVTKAMALRARAFMNSYLNLTDQVVKDSQEALKLLENEKNVDHLK